MQRFAVHLCVLTKSKKGSLYPYIWSKITLCLLCFYYLHFVYKMHQKHHILLMPLFFLKKKNTAFWQVKCGVLTMSKQSVDFVKCTIYWLHPVKCDVFSFRKNKEVEEDSTRRVEVVSLLTFYFVKCKQRMEGRSKNKVNNV